MPSRGALVGILAKPRAGRNRKQELRFVEARIGRRFDIDHDYIAWNAEFPTSYEKWDLASGRIPLITWGSRRRDGTRVSWRAIAAGRHDRWIRSRAAAVRAVGKRVMINFHHEPEDERGLNGTRADYRAAWRHIVTVFRNRGATNAVWVWALMGWTFDPHSAESPRWWWPGRAYVDWIGADAYNWYPCRSVPWRSFKEIFRPFYRWASTRRRPLMVAEYGVTEDTATPRPLRKARWVGAMRAGVKTWPRIKALVYFNGDLWNHGSCPWWIDSTAASLSAFRAFVHDPYYNPRRR